MRAAVQQQSAVGLEHADHSRNAIDNGVQILPVLAQLAFELTYALAEALDLGGLSFYDCGLVS